MCFPGEECVPICVCVFVQNHLPLLMSLGKKAKRGVSKSAQSLFSCLCSAAPTPSLDCCTQRYGALAQGNTSILFKQY